MRCLLPGISATVMAITVSLKRERERKTQRDGEKKTKFPLCSCCLKKEGAGTIAVARLTVSNPE